MAAERSIDRLLDTDMDTQTPFSSGSERKIFGVRSPNTFGTTTHLNIM